jgi:glycosyltransferase involved in cell wall biosynthesis
VRLPWKLGNLAPWFSLKVGNDVAIPRCHYRFSVVTPTFNRAETLNRPYESLRAQTISDFEWLVVDDGSTDRTASLVREWQGTASFPIRYFHQTNCGKHVAFNRAVREATGELLVQLDSDDACADNALERFDAIWRAIPRSRQIRFAGIWCLCVDQTGRLTGTPFPRDGMDTTAPDVYYRYGVKGEKWFCYKTEVLRQFPFPEPPGFTYVPESIVWSRMTRKYLIRCVNEALRVYWTVGPSITRSGTSHMGREACRLQHLTALNEYTPWFADAPLLFLKSGVHYSRFSFHARRPVRSQFRDVRSWIGKGVLLLTMPGGYLAYLNDSYPSRQGRRSQLAPRHVAVADRPVG